MSIIPTSGTSLTDKQLVFKYDGSNNYYVAKIFKLYAAIKKKTISTSNAYRTTLDGFNENNLLISDYFTSKTKGKDEIETQSKQMDELQLIEEAKKLFFFYISMGEELPIVLDATNKEWLNAMDAGYNSAFETKVGRAYTSQGYALKVYTFFMLKGIHLNYSNGANIVNKNAMSGLMLKYWSAAPWFEPFQVSESGRLIPWNYKKGWLNKDIATYLACEMFLLPPYWQNEIKTKGWKKDLEVYDSKADIITIDGLYYWKNCPASVVFLFHLDFILKTVLKEPYPAFFVDKNSGVMPAVLVLTEWKQYPDRMFNDYDAFIPFSYKTTWADKVSAGIKLGVGAVFTIITAGLLTPALAGMTKDSLATFTADKKADVLSSFFKAQKDELVNNIKQQEEEQKRESEKSGSIIIVVLVIAAIAVIGYFIFKSKGKI